MIPLELSETRGIASRLRVRNGVIRISLSGPQVGSWALEHIDDDLREFGFFVSGGGPQFEVRCVGRRAVGPAYIEGRIDLGLVVEQREFANSFEAAQIALERLAQLPDAPHLANADMRIEVESEQ